MPTSHTTRLALQLTRLALEADRLARQLAAEEHLEHEPLLPGAMYLLATAIDYVDDALYSAENDGPTRRANFLAAARVIAYPDQVAQAALPETPRPGQQEPTLAPRVADTPALASSGQRSRAIRPAHLRRRRI